MTKTKTRSKDKTAPAESTATPAPAKANNGRALRETIESFVVALVWAFLFRTFEAEAFVIPTGSMAPTLMGAHLDVVCPTCNFNFRSGATEKLRVTEVICPMCRTTTNVDPGTEAGNANPVYNGDRVIVTKFAYEFAEPERWDVFVFKYPQQAKTNYIKRLVGLPNEALRIYHGDVFTRPIDDLQASYEIVRKPPDKLLAMTQLVYDNDYVVDAMTNAGWPLRWQDWPSDRKEPQWVSSDGGRSFAIANNAPAAAGEGEPAWLRYQNFIPTVETWDAMHKGELKGDSPPRPRLITDYYAYNDIRIDARINGRIEHVSADGGMPFGADWVADLRIDAELDVTGPAGTILLDLVAGGRHFGCEFEVETGKARLTIEGQPDFHPAATTGVRGPGKHRVAFANFDRQLTLWVDDKLVAFDALTTYEALDNDVPTAADLAPAGIGSRGAALTVNHLRIGRDLYYIADDSTATGGPICDFRENSELFHVMIGGLQRAWERGEFLSDPRRWTRDASGKSIFDERREMIFELHKDQFFALGDNSPMSADSRLWNEQHYVDRYLLIGKAVFVYWPRASYNVPLHFWGVDTSIPVVPNFGRMRFVR